MAEQVVRLATAYPDMTTADIAQRVGMSTRTVRRHLAAHRAATTGHPPTPPPTPPPAASST